MIILKQHSGYCCGELVLWSMDQVILKSAVAPDELLGFSDRRPGAPFQAVANAIPEAVLADVLDALKRRDCEGVPDALRPAAEAQADSREVLIPPTITDDDDLEDDE